MLNEKLQIENLHISSGSPWKPLKARTNTLMKLTTLDRSIFLAGALIGLVSGTFIENPEPPLYEGSAIAEFEDTPLLSNIDERQFLSRLGSAFSRPTTSLIFVTTLINDLWNGANDGALSTDAAISAARDSLLSIVGLQKDPLNLKALQQSLLNYVQSDQKQMTLHVKRPEKGRPYFYFDVRENQLALHFSVDQPKASEPLQKALFNAMSSLIRAQNEHDAKQISQRSNRFLDAAVLALNSQIKQFSTVSGSLQLEKNELLDQLYQIESEVSAVEATHTGIKPDRRNEIGNAVDLLVMSRQVQTTPDNSKPARKALEFGVTAAEIKHLQRRLAFLHGVTDETKITNLKNRLSTTASALEINSAQLEQLATLEDTARQSLLKTITSSKTLSEVAAAPLPTLKVETEGKLLSLAAAKPVYSRAYYYAASTTIGLISAAVVSALIALLRSKRPGAIRS